MKTSENSFLSSSSLASRRSEDSRRRALAVKKSFFLRKDHRLEMQFLHQEADGVPFY
jgi:hypothetical protein